MDGESGINHTGWLTKEGGSIKTWRKRWFILKTDTITYHKSATSAALGTIDVASSSSVRPINYKGKKNCFEIRTPRRTYHLFAETPKDMQGWIAVLKDAQAACAVASAGGGGSPPADTESASATLIEKEAASTGKRGVDSFEIETVIGKGSFGKVMQVREKDTGQVYAMKVLNKKTIIERNELEHTKAEKSILMKLDHPFLVHLYYSFQTENKLYFIMDYINGGELFFHLQKEKKFSDKRVRFYGAEIVLGLSYLHSQGVIYRDLKPENLLITNEGHICMTDFGISKEGLTAKDDRTATFCGTPEYLAPEVLEGKGYGKEVDWWSFGTLIFEMLTGLPPFYSEDVQLMYSKIMNAKLKIPSSINSDAKSLITGLLERDPEARLSEPEEIKAHPYFKSIDWDELYHKYITPPYIPAVKGADDTSQIDPVFTEEAPVLSVVADSDITASVQENFSGFTYVAGSELSK